MRSEREAWREAWLTSMDRGNRLLGCPFHTSQRLSRQVEKWAPARKSRRGSLHPPEKAQEILPEDPLDDLFGVAAAQELRGDDGQLRDVFQALRRVLDSVEVGAQADRLRSGDLDDVLDVIDDLRPGRARSRDGVEQLADRLVAPLRVGGEILLDLQVGGEELRALEIHRLH